MHTPHVVIIGGGFGGVYTARFLSPFAKNGSLKITLINRNNFFLFTPLLHEVAAGSLSATSVVEPIREIFRDECVRFVQTEVKNINIKEKTVITNTGTIPYDFLVVSTGADTNFYGVTGAQEHSLTLKNLADAIRIRNRIISSFEKASHTEDAEERKRLLSLIVVGGGPAPGINGVIAAATIEAINRGYKVLGIHTGFKRLMKGDMSCISELTHADVSWIQRDGGSKLGTARTNPTKSPELLDTVVRSLTSQNVGYLVTIGGDDTATSARAVARAAKGSILVGHVPKTIDNDLPLPNKVNTFGFQSAREVGTEIAETLMVDAETTSRWYLVVAMGRKAGHLALGIGISAGTTLTIIPEECEGKTLTLQELADVIVGSILKRLAQGRPWGVCVLAEGLAEILDVNSIPELLDAERDPHGHIRFAEVDFGKIVKDAVRARLEAFGIKDLLVVDKNVGYELRCRPPIPFDREYTQQLGFGVIDNLLAGRNEFMISRQGDELVPIPFDEIMDPATGRAKVRMVDTDSAIYRIARSYMIRLSEDDLAKEVLMGKMSDITKTPVADLRKEFSGVAKRFGRL